MAGVTIIVVVVVVVVVLLLAGLVELYSHPDRPETETQKFHRSVDDFFERSPNLSKEDPAAAVLCWVHLSKHHPELVGYMDREFSEDGYPRMSECVQLYNDGTPLEEVVQFSQIRTDEDPVPRERDNTDTQVSKQPRELDRADAEAASEIDWSTVVSVYDLSTELQRKERWKEFEGRKVRWTGRVTGVNDDLILFVSMTSESHAYRLDALIHLKDCERSHALLLNEEDSVTFTGILEYLLDSGTVTLEGGEILDLEATASDAAGHLLSGNIQQEPIPPA